ncbi:MAG: sodium/proton antiporter NhaB [Acidobacteria bacterium]|nr:sodium/proton antiporter NhaB [Acidobacteriota bacterium]
MATTLGGAFARNFLGTAPSWYKLTIVAFLLANPLLLILFGPTVTGWLIIGEFIFTLAMALRCYPLQPGGLIALESLAIGLVGPEAVYHEVEANLPVLLLLMFMVAGIYFMRELLLFIFTKLLVKVRSKTLLSLLFSLTAAGLSAFLDALTVTAVIITVSAGFFAIYHKVASGRGFDDDHDHWDDDLVRPPNRSDLERFRSFLRSLMMHAAVGTALGGVCTLVGEPQNLLIGRVMEWDFATFFLKVAPVSMPVLAAGIVTCVVLERIHWFGYGERLPDPVREVIERYDRLETAAIDQRKKMRLAVQAVAALFLILGLALHIAEVGLIGLTVIVFTTAFNGIIEEKRIGHAFEEALPFAALLVAFFAIVALIHEQELFKPVVNMVLATSGSTQLAWMYGANGLLSAISDNVFVATVYITEIRTAFEAGAITREQYDLLAVAVNTGTNIPSVATPNGQAAFLFLLTSTLAPLIRLSYVRMIWMALPYTIVMSITGLLAVLYVL